MEMIVCVYVACEQTKGELSAERKEKCETMQHNFQKLLQTTQTLAVSRLIFIIIIITSVPKVIWQEGRIAAL